MANDLNNIKKQIAQLLETGQLSPELLQESVARQRHAQVENLLAQGQLSADDIQGVLDQVISKKSSDIKTNAALSQVSDIFGTTNPRIAAHRMNTAKKKSTGIEIDPNRRTGGLIEQTKDNISKALDQVPIVNQFIPDILSKDPLTGNVVKGESVSGITDFVQRLKAVYRDAKGKIDDALLGKTVREQLLDQLPDDLLQGKTAGEEIRTTAGPGGVRVTKKQGSVASPSELYKAGEFRLKNGKRVKFNQDGSIQVN